jgi:diacylglycerol kinase family enzyme
MQPLVLVNALAGAAAEGDPADLADRIGRAFAAFGPGAEVRRFHPEDMTAVLEQARRSDRPVVVAGGDGTVGAAVQLYAGTQTPLGIIPLGTYNLLAHDLGMSTDPEEAVRQIASAQERRIDLGRIGRRYFHTLGGLGFFARIARERAHLRKETGAPKVLVAALAAVRSLAHGDDLEVEIDTGERRERLRSPAVLITNNPLDADTWRRPRLDLGLFEINVVRGDVPLPLLQGGLAALAGSWRDSPDILTWKTAHATIRPDRDRVHLNVDGEVTRPRSPLRFAMAPAALTVLAAPGPADSAAETVEALAS